MVVKGQFCDPGVIFRWLGFFSIIFPGLLSDRFELCNRKNHGVLPRLARSFIDQGAQGVMDPLRVRLEVVDQGDSLIKTI